MDVDRIVRDIARSRWNVSYFNRIVWEPGSIPLKFLAVSITSWSLAYCIVLRLLGNRCYIKVKDNVEKVTQISPEYCCRLVTFIHGLLTTTLCAVLHFNDGPVWNNLGLTNSPFHNTIVLISLGYFLFDFIWCSYMGSEGAAMLAHHILSLFGLFYTTYYHKYGAEVTAVCFGAEITNPMLQIRWFLREHNLYHTQIGVVNDYVFVFSFFFWRFVVGTYFLYRASLSDKVGGVIFGGGVGLYLISIVFMYHIAKFFVRKYVWKMKKKDE